MVVVQRREVNYLLELREVKLSRLHPNPWRDGTGAATWESVAKVYGYDERKLEELEGSLKANGFWAGTHARQRKDGDYELVFGHHRVEAARRAGLTSIPVLLGGYSDDQMLRMMASENNEEYGHDFALGVLNAVEATIAAFDSGRVELPKPERARYFTPQQKKPYTAEGLAGFLGWTLSNGKAAPKTHTAVQALELLGLGALKRTQLKGLGHHQARELVGLISRKLEAEQQQLEIQQNFLEEKAKQAKAAGDKNKERQLKAKVEELTSTAPKHLASAGQLVASAVKQHFERGASIRGALEEVAKEVGVEPAKPKGEGKQPKVVDLSAVESLAEKYDRLALLDDPAWRKVLKLAGESKARKTFFSLASCMSSLSKRLAAREKELMGVLKQ